MSITHDLLAQYMCRGDPELKDYYPEWLKDIAEDATVEGSMLDGVVVGAENVRSVVLKIKSLYDRQEFISVGRYGENDWIEEYTAHVHGKPLGCVALVKRNGAGQTRHVVASYRPRSSVAFFARLLAQEFAGTALAKHFAANDS